MEKQHVIIIITLPAAALAELRTSGLAIRCWFIHVYVCVYWRWWWWWWRSMWREANWLSQNPWIHSSAVRPTYE